MFVVFAAFDVITFSNSDAGGSYTPTKPLTKDKIRDRIKLNQITTIKESMP